MYLFSKNCCGDFWATFVIIWATFISPSGHTGEYDDDDGVCACAFYYYYDDYFYLLMTEYPFNDVKTRTNDCQRDWLRNAKQISSRVGRLEGHVRWTEIVNACSIPFCRDLSNFTNKGFKRLNAFKISLFSYFFFVIKKVS